MSRDNLQETLQLMVTEHGLKQVQQHLDAIAHLEQVKKGSTESSNKPDESPDERPRRRRSAKPSATRYVARIEFSEELSAEMAELAVRFDAKLFLPTFSDVRNFCDIYGVDVPGSKTRSSAIPRVFKRLASMDVADIQSIIHHGHFSGPSRLGPISDAIRRNGRGESAQVSARIHTT